MDAKRNFLEVALTTGMDNQLISPADVLRHIEPQVLASHLPDEAKTKLLAASLTAGKMDPALVFETLSPRVFAEHMPEAMVWACIAEAAERALKAEASALGSAASKVTKPSSLLGDTKSSRTTRRPPPTRRPVRRSQSRVATTKESKTEFDLDADVANWSKKDSVADEVFGDWVEETMTGPDDLPRRKR